MTASVALPLRIGARTVWRFRRRLVQSGVPLEQGLRSEPPVLPPLPPGADGYMVNALPVARLASLAAAHPELIRNGCSTPACRTEKQCWPR